MIIIIPTINLVLPTKMCRHGHSNSFIFFEAQQNMLSASTQASESRNKRRSVVSGLTGQQAPLGNHQGQCPVQLCTETSRNIGTGRLRQMHMGDVNVEVLGDDTMN
jgi:hypothetical protein